MSKKGFEIFEQGIRYVIDNENELRKLYGGNIYLAIYGNEGVIGSDKSESLLFRKLGYRDGILISTLDDIIAKADKLFEEEIVS